MIGWAEVDLLWVVNCGQGWERVGCIARGLKYWDRGVVVGYLHGVKWVFSAIFLMSWARVRVFRVLGGLAERVVITGSCRGILGKLGYMVDFFRRVLDKTREYGML